MTDTTPELVRYVNTVNGFCADLVAEDSEASSFTLDDLRRRIDKHRESCDDPGRVLAALSVACGYETQSARPDPHADMAVGEWVPGWTDVEYDSMVMCPPPLGRVDISIRDAWAQLAREDCLHPLVRARIADLLSTLGHHNSYESGQIAVQGYLEALTDPAIDERERMVALKRAALLCNEFRDPSLLRIVEQHQSTGSAHQRTQSDDDEAPAAA